MKPPPVSEPYVLLCKTDGGAAEVHLRDASISQLSQTALGKAGFRSWTSVGEGSTEWLPKKFGDVHLHETVISHVRRLSETDFICKHLCETPRQFTARMQRVEDHMNSSSFAAPGRRGLTGLAKELRTRCELVIASKGQRVPK